MRKSDWMRAGTRVLGVMPTAVADIAGRVVGDVCWVVLRQRRRVILENLRYTAAHRTRADHDRLGRATFRNLVRCSADFLRVPLLQRNELLGLVELQGRHHLDAALARGHGVLLVTAHVGNWELAAAYWGAQGYRGRAVAEDEAIDPEVFRTYTHYRTATGMDVIPLSRAASAGYDTLREGLGLALLADRAIGSASRVVRFCRGYRAVPIGPALLARRAKAPIVVLSLVLSPEGPRRYRMTIEAPIEPPRTREESDGLVETIADRLSAIVSRHPDQWFVFQPDWQSAPSAPQ